MCMHYLCTHVCIYVCTIARQNVLATILLFPWTLVSLWKKKMIYLHSFVSFSVCTRVHVHRSVKAMDALYVRVLFSMSLPCCDTLRFTFLWVCICMCLMCFCICFYVSPYFWLCVYVISCHNVNHNEITQSCN